jgi:hypothetical protein
VHGISYPAHPVTLRGGEDEVSNNLGIRGGKEGIAPFREFPMQLLGVDNIPIVGDSQSLLAITDNNRLSISPMAISPVRWLNASSSNTWDTSPIRA